MRLGTRASPLALTQAELAANHLARKSIPCDIIPITTEGDIAKSLPASDKGRWVKELDEALLCKEIDFAVHSAKDIPGVLPEGIQISAVLPRANPYDGICFADTTKPYTSLQEVPSGSRIGTSSLRRAAQIHAQRADVHVEPVRGNVGTRLQKLYSPTHEYDAIVLALAGLERLGHTEIALPLTVDEMVPAPGQGIIAITTRTDDKPTYSTMRTIHDTTTATCLQIERNVAQELAATCDTPLGAHAYHVTETTLALHVFFGEPDGSRWVRDQLAGDSPEDLAKHAAQRIQQTYMQL